ncbi:MAG: hypothetical protein GY863_18440, partial [bacterium]|nr:hypothetical protein [bacterium]
IYEVYIYDSPAGTKFVMVGEGFDSIANSTITIELAADSLFAGTTYNVTDLVITPDPNRNDRMRGFLSVPASTIVSGQFFIRFTVDGSPHIQRLYFSDPTEQIYINQVEAEESPSPGNTELFIHGENFNLMKLTGIDFSPDSTFTDSVYSASDYSIFSNNELYARVAYDYFDLRIQKYFVRLKTSLGPIVVGFDFEGQEITIDDIELVESTTSGQTIVRMSGKGFSQIDLANITVIVSNDGTFATNVYTVTSMAYTVESTGDIISGTIEADYSALPTGNWYMRVIDTSDQDSFIFPFYFGTSAHSGKILDLEVFPGYSGGTDVKIFAENFEVTEIDSIHISSDVTFAAASTIFSLLNISISEEAGGFLMITGGMNVAYTIIPEGDYYVKIFTSSGASVVSLPFRFEIDVSDVPPPEITSYPEVLYGDTTSVTIGWETDKPATSEIEYNTLNDFNGGNFEIIDSVKVTSHVVRITGLTPGTTYKYRVMSTDENGKMTGAGDYTFSTSLVLDDTPPVIAYAQIYGRDTSSVTIGWETNELATSLVEYNTTTLWKTGAKLYFEDTTLVKDHKVTITG